MYPILYDKYPAGNESGIECCNDQGFVDPSLSHPACFPIEIPADDPFFSRFGRRCMNFVRSMPTQNENCTFGNAEQVTLRNLVVLKYTLPIHSLVK